MSAEQTRIGGSAEVLWQPLGPIELGEAVDFVYVMRKDGEFAMSPIAHAVAGSYGLNEAEAKQSLLEAYDTYFARLVDAQKQGYAAKGAVQLHIFDADELAAAVHGKAAGKPIVSLDPLTKDGVLEHKVSRGYYLGGAKDFGQVARPGAEPLPMQAKAIASQLHGQPAVVAEDDIFSGGSAAASVKDLLAHGVAVDKLVVGFVMGEPTAVTELGVAVDAVVAYSTSDGSDIFNKVDLGDPRDYLLGASGLVVQLPGGELGRVPYLLPFASTAERASLPTAAEVSFSEAVLEANLAFYTQITEQLGRPVLLGQVNPAFAHYMHELFGFSAQTPMEQVVTWALDNLEAVWEATLAYGSLQEQLAPLQLPKKLVLLDVNGTLFADESTDGFMPADGVQAFQQAVQALNQHGICVGLCSDSPLPQLQQLAGELGLTGPIVAENGNVVSYNDQTVAVNELPGIAIFKQHVAELASEQELKQSPDFIAPEFGGQPVAPGSWGFGAHRVASVSVSGPAPFIEALGQHFSSWPGISVDCSPEYNFLAIHPGPDFTQGKANTLQLLAQHGCGVVMVGNSMSDWAGPNSGVLSTFVGRARISPGVQSHSAYVSSQPLLAGVVDILNHLVDGAEGAKP